MGFTGVIVLVPETARRTLLEMAEDLGDDEGEELLTSGWTYSVFYGSDIANLDTEGAVREVVRRSGGPALWSSVFDSNFATLAAANAGPEIWFGCLDREGLIQNTEELIHASGYDGDVKRYLLDFEQTLPSLQRWCRTAGLQLDELEAAQVLRTTGPYAQELVIELFGCMGLTSRV